MDLYICFLCKLCLEDNQYLKHTQAYSLDMDLLYIQVCMYKHRFQNKQHLVHMVKDYKDHHEKVLALFISNNNITNKLKVKFRQHESLTWWRLWITICEWVSSILIRT
jgi:hypothetical protein